MKWAKNEDEAFKLQETHKDNPHGWIQWKGTNACMDIYCKCGAHSHVDADFVYNVKCPACGQVYQCSGYIELIALEVQPENCVVTGD